MQSKKIQLFILPYAGGSAAAFGKLTGLINAEIEVVAVEYPGRGTRAKEPLSVSFQEMLEDAVNYCREKRREEIPYCMMGYSMGSVLAYEILARKAIPGELRHFFIAAEVSPKERALELRKVANPTEERILQRVAELGGLDERLLKNQRFREIYINPMLNDYRRFFEYRFPGYSDRLMVDATVFYSEKDTAFLDVVKWKELIQGEIEYYQLGENHFFINQLYRKMAEVINETIIGTM
ncbi:MAG: alpha/beta fold hydrolase [Eubacteriales bacterium]|nr:alpha/beta fold hydrolase [Eubacteriales bacterium]